MEKTKNQQAFDTLIENPPLVDVSFQQKLGDRIQCKVCPHECKLEEGSEGVCGGKKVIDGRLAATNYGMITSLNLDPIEKKPLYHFYPGSEILSVGPNGCNLRCKWCQNWQISQNFSPTRLVLPDQLVDMVDALDGIGVAYTYAEPLIWFEYARDAGRLLHERGLVNLFISNGYINEQPLKELLPYTDAFNIDLKVQDDRCYMNYCGGRLEDVQRTIRIIHDSGKHLELTHLLVTGVSTDLKKFEMLIDWIASIDKSIPLHLTRYFPANRYEEPPTDIEFMKDALDLAKSKLDWVYLGNLWTGEGQDSYCKCGALLVKRDGFNVEMVNLNSSYCKVCGAEVNFVIDDL